MKCPIMSQPGLYDPTTIMYENNKILNKTNKYRYMKRPVMSQPGLYDPTTIMNADILNYCMREGWCKLCFYLVTFFYYLYR